MKRTTKIAFAAVKPGEVFKSAGGTYLKLDPQEFRHSGSGFPLTAVVIDGVTVGSDGPGRLVSYGPGTYMVEVEREMPTISSLKAGQRFRLSQHPGPSGALTKIASAAPGSCIDDEFRQYILPDTATVEVIS